VLLLFACDSQATGRADGGSPDDAGTIPDDAKAIPDDASTTAADAVTTDDAGTIPDDAGAIRDDTSTTTADTVTTTADASTTTDDTGTMTGDAGAIPDDASTTTADAGTNPADGGEVMPDGGVRAPVDGGFAILGDSNSDEYRADDDRGGAYSSVTFNWMEQLVMARALDFGAWGTWGGDRRTGFEYNWARSGARAADLVGQGQAAGVAQQVEDGAVKYVYVHIGSNDFHLVNGTYREIYDGTLTDAQVAAKVAEVVGDVTAAVDTVLAESPERIVVTLFGDPGLNPRALATYPSAAGRNRVSMAIESVNQGLTRMATTRPQVTLYDLNEFANSLLGRIDADGNLDVGDELISMVEAGDEPHHAQLGDRSGHLGTVASGLFANATFIGPFNQAEQLGIPMLTDAEILSHAGL
jgi:hypothetical protein